MYNTNSHELAILRVCKTCGDEYHKKHEMEKVGEFHYCHFCLLEGDDFAFYGLCAPHYLYKINDDDFADGYSNPKGGI